MPSNRAAAAKLRWLPDKFSPGFIQTLDKRTDLYGRLNYSYEQIVDDCGGADGLPRTKLALVERFCFMEEFLRRIELRIAEDPVKHIDLIGKWTQGVNAMNGLAKVLGLTVAEKGDFLDALYRQEPTRTPQPPSEGSEATDPATDSDDNNPATETFPAKPRKRGRKAR